MSFTADKLYLNKLKSKTNYDPENDIKYYSWLHNIKVLLKIKLLISNKNIVVFLSFLHSFSYLVVSLLKATILSTPMLIY